MKYFVLTAMIGCSFCTTVFAEDPTPMAPPEPRTHIDTTVVGSSVTGQPGESAPPTLDNTHNFAAGEPELVRTTKRLKLSPKQESQLHDVIEKADAGAAVLIKREHDVQEMIAATTPADPAYATLIAEQGTASAQWTENRESLRRDVLSILTPAQQRRFEDLQAQEPKQ